MKPLALPSQLGSFKGETETRRGGAQLMVTALPEVSHLSAHILSACESSYPSQLSHTRGKLNPDGDSSVNLCFPKINIYVSWAVRRQGEAWRTVCPQGPPHAPVSSSLTCQPLTHTHPHSVGAGLWDYLTLTYTGHPLSHLWGPGHKPCSPQRPGWGGGGF